MKFRKKPVVIDAVQFDVGGAHKYELPDGVIITKFSPGADNFNYMGFEFGIQTLEGLMQVRDRDWVITGIKGERYPCKPDIFAATYEVVEAESASLLREGRDDTILIVDVGSARKRKLG